MAKGLRGTSLFADANLVAYWELESGALTTDSKASYTLTNSNSVSSGTGQFGGAADYGSSNTNKNLGVTSDLGITNGTFSISLWVKLNTEVGVGAEYSFVSSEDTTNDILKQINYYETGGTRRVAFRRWRQGIAADEVTYDVTLGTSNWSHFVVTYDATNLRGYYNGSLVAGPTAFSGDGSGVATAQTNIGSYRNSSNYSSVLIDDVAFFNDALTAGEVTTLYNAPTSDSGGFMMYY
ncbi:MAG: LamG domain-containing protein [Chloroflexi bacterium]|nr:LamG domain-containing protein [Chloroflexota bacterium]